MLLDNWLRIRQLRPINNHIFAGEIICAVFDALHECKLQSFYDFFVFLLLIGTVLNDKLHSAAVRRGVTKAVPTIRVLFRLCMYVVGMERRAAVVANGFNKVYIQ